MRVEPNIAPIAALFGEPSRAAILTVLLDGRALPAGELAGVAGINSTAASGHLSKLVNGGLLAVDVEGRHRYYRLANPAVATVIEDLAQLSGRPPIFNLPKLSPSARALRQARTCYDHLAGQLAVAIAATLESRGWLVRGEGKRYEIGNEAGRQWFANQGVNFQTDMAWQDNGWRVPRADQPASTDPVRSLDSDPESAVATVAGSPPAGFLLRLKSRRGQQPAAATNPDTRKLALSNFANWILCFLPHSRFNLSYVYRKSKIP